MILLVGQGATVTETSESRTDWTPTLVAASRLLEKRGHFEAARILRSHDWRVLDGTNVFGDEFQVLSAEVSIDDYVSLAAADRRPFRTIADAVCELGPFARFVTLELRQETGVPVVSTPEVSFSMAAVARAIADAERLLNFNGPVSAVDRIHTALHGFLKDLVVRMGLPVPPDASITAVLKLVRSQRMNDRGAHEEAMDRVLRAAATIVDVLNSLRNTASVAHPNTELLGDAEAMLVINLAKSILGYLDARVAPLLLQNQTTTA